jgi:hypothetical protein
MKVLSCFTCATIWALLVEPIPVRVAGLIAAQQPVARDSALRPAIAGDAGKMVVELPTKRLIASAAVKPVSKNSVFVNPNVPAGKVHWHPSFDAARKAAEKSRKPVLLFQMMGKLDDQFC